MFLHRVLLFPFEGADEMHSIFTQVVDDWLQGVVVGSEVEVEGASQEMVSAVCHPELERGGDLLAGNVVNLSPDASIGVLDDGILYIVRFLIVEFHHLLLLHDEVAKAVGILYREVGELESGVEAGIVQVNPVCAVILFFDSDV